MTCVESCDIGEAAIITTNAKTCTKCTGTTDKVSSDKITCIDHCNIGEVIVTSNNAKICSKCTGTYDKVS